MRKHKGGEGGHIQRLAQYEVVQHGGNGTMKVAEGQIEVKGKRHKLKRATEQGGIFGFDEAKLNDVLDEASEQIDEK